MPQTVMKAAGNHSNIRLVNDPSMPTLEELIREAHVHVLPSMNETGVKLKLLHALFTGRFCLTNTPGIEGSGISAGVEVVDGKEEFRNKLEELLSREFKSSDIEDRQYITQLYNNRENAETLNALW